MKKRLLSIMLAVTMISAPMPSMVYAAEDGWVSDNESADEGTEELSTDSFVSESVEKSSEEITELCPHGNDPSTCPECTGGTVVDTSFAWEFSCDSEKINVGDVVTFTARAVGPEGGNPADFGPIDIEHFDRDRLEYSSSTSPDYSATSEFIYTYSFVAKAPGIADVTLMYHDENHSPQSLNAFVEIIQPEEIPGPNDTEITITKQPENCFVGAGNEFSFSVEALGGDLHYEWFWFNGKRWIAVGEDSNTYSGTAERTLDNSKFKCVVSNDTQEIESAMAQLLINEEFAIISQPVDAGDILFGDTVRFEVEATGSENIYYEWMQSKDGSTWDYIGCSEPVLEVTADLNSEGYYLCEISNDHEEELESDVVSFSLIKRELEILTGDSSQEAEEISYFYKDDLQLYADVQKFDGIEYWYEWECNDGNGWYGRGYDRSEDIEDNTARIYFSGDTAEDDIDGRQYRLHVWDSQGKDAYSKTYIVKVTKTSFDWLSHPAIGHVAESGNLNDGFSIDEYKETVSVNYEEPFEFFIQFKPTWGWKAISRVNMCYAWECNDGEGWYESGFDGDNWNWKNENSEDADVVITSFFKRNAYDDENGRQYRFHIWDERGNDFYSEPVTVNVVKDELKIVTQPVSKEIYFNDQATFTVEAEGNDVQYQWECYDEESGNWNRYFYNGVMASEFWGNELSVHGNPEIDGTRFRCRIWDMQNQEIYSDEVILTVNKKELRILSQTETENGILEVNYAEPIKIDVTVNRNENIATWVELEIDEGNGYESREGSLEMGEDTIHAWIDFLNAYPYLDGARLRFHIWDEQGYDLYSDEITIKVIRQKLAITTQPEDVKTDMFSGFTLKIAAIGKNLNYQWQRSQDGENWENRKYWYFSDEGTPYLEEELNPDSMNYQYRCRIWDDQEQEIYSDTVTVALDRSIESVETGKHVSDIDKYGFFRYTPSESGRYFVYSVGENMDNTGNSSDTCVEIFNSKWEFVDFDSDGGKDQNFALCVNLEAGETYYICMRYEDNSLSGTVQWVLTPYEEPAIQSQTGDIVLKQGERTDLSVDAVGTELSYCWYYSRNAGKTWKPMGHFDPSVSIRGTKANNGYMYYCRVDDLLGNSTFSNPITLTVTKAEFTVATPETEVLAVEDGPVTLNVAAIGTELSYEWYYSRNNGLTWRRTYCYEPEYSFQASLRQDGYLYYCNVMDGYGNEQSSDEILLKVEAEKRKLSNAVIELQSETYEYTGKVIKPDFAVKYNDKALAEGVDYVVITSGECTQLGENSVVVNGIGNYTGEMNVKFKVVEPEISELKVANYPNKMVYNCGDEFVPDGMRFYINYANGAVRCVSAEEPGITFSSDISVAHPVVKAAYKGYYAELTVSASHNAVTDEAVKPTETKPGKTEGSHCAGCGEVLVAQKEIPATGFKEGWQKNSKGWWYQNADGSYPKSQWKFINGNWYHFNENGYMQTGWLQLGSTWYYLKDSGAMAKDEWVENGKYYLDGSGKYIPGKTQNTEGWMKNSKGWWYRNADGSYPQNAWKKINGKWYHFDANGYMQTGWLQLGTTWYYLKASGAMAENEWVENGKYYVDASGKYIPGKTK